MSTILHIVQEQKERKRLGTAVGALCLAVVLLAAAVLGTIGTARALQPETVALASLADFEACLLDVESERYDPAGRYVLAGDVGIRKWARWRPGRCWARRCWWCEGSAKDRLKIG